MLHGSPSPVLLVVRFVVISRICTAVCQGSLRSTGAQSRFKDRQQLGSTLCCSNSRSSSSSSFFFFFLLLSSFFFFLLLSSSFFFFLLLSSSFFLFFFFFLLSSCSYMSSRVERNSLMRKGLLGVPACRCCAEASLSKSCFKMAS